MYLGIAAARLGQYERALIALKKAVELNPHLVQAMSWQAFVYRKIGDDKMASICRNECARIRRSLNNSQSPALLLPDSREIPTPDSESDRAAELLRKRPLRRDPKANSGRVLNVVSGLPRSGTSLLMQMLEAGGMSPKTDGLRQADTSNPNGYFEWESIKQLTRRKSILDDPALTNKAVKVVSPLLQHLPLCHRYRVVFVLRSIEEVAASQMKMIEENGESFRSSQFVDQFDLVRRLTQHRDEALNYIRSRPEFDVLEISFRDLIDSSEIASNELGKFLGSSLLPHPDVMSQVVDKALYRQRKSSMSITS